MFSWDRAYDGILALLVSYIGVKSNVFKKADEMAGFGIFLWAFFILFGGWFVVSLIRAPFLVLAQDREKGQWHGNRYIYKQPFLVATLHCKPTGSVERYPIVFSDAEPGSFANTKIEVEGADQLIELGFELMLRFDRYRQSGIRLTNGCEATLMVRLPEKAVSTTVRVYCTNFAIGNPDDKDGEKGKA